MTRTEFNYSFCGEERIILMSLVTEYPVLRGHSIPAASGSASKTGKNKVPRR